MTAPQPVKPDLGPWLPLLDSYEMQVLPHDTVLRGTLRTDLDPGAPEVRTALEAWSAPAYLSHEGDVTEIVLVYPHGAPPSRRLWLHVSLLAATLLTTLAAGAMLGGIDPFHTRFVPFGGVLIPYPSRIRLGALMEGVPFAIPFMGVLLAHEMSHYAAARAHRIRASLPYFIPFPPYLSVIGTVGAFIRLRSPTVRRAALFDVGAAGPIASFALSIPLLLIGLSRSVPIPGHANPTSPYLVQLLGQPIWLGNGLFMELLARLVTPGASMHGPILLDRLAFAGWLGLFVTALNLLPLGQLDGGHVLYALLQGRQARAARWFLLALIPLGFLWWGWWAWGLLIVALHRGRLGHPTVAQEAPPIGPGRTVVAWLMILVFFLTFVPVPIRL
jgi:membrane-associated protease RseP (regulator of RpoE activity)